MTVGTFYPLPQNITSITLGRVTVVGFAQGNTFVNGQVVSFRITKPYGTFELNNQQATVLQNDASSITVDIESTFYTPFIYPAVTTDYVPQCIPSSSGILPLSAMPQTNLQCAFDHEPPL
jgi:hypothetical protein